VLAKQPSAIPDGHTGQKRCPTYRSVHLSAPAGFDSVLFVTEKGFYAQTFNLLVHRISVSFTPANQLPLPLPLLPRHHYASSLYAFEAFVLPLGMLFQRPQTTAATSLFARLQVAKFTNAQIHIHKHIHTHTLTLTKALTYSARKFCSCNVISTWQNEKKMYIYKKL